MTPEQRRQVRDLFEQAVEQPPEAAEAYVRAHAAEPAVADEVLSLLRHHSMAGAFLEEAVAGRVPDLLDEEPVFEPGQRVGRYAVEREIGRGGMGRIYLATDTQLGRRVALKVLAPRFVRDGVQRERLRREARAAAVLTHPGICTVFALEEIGDAVLVVTEFVDGRTLRDEIDAGTRPDPARLIETARELASAIASAHARGITHRDLKPENIMRTADGRLKILDFGLALISPEASDAGAPRVTTPGTLVGTPAYMAPEQLNGGTVDARTDVFALGVVLYEYATGVHPFHAASALATIARILESEPQPMADLRADIPPLVRTVVHQCLRKPAAERFAHAGDVVLALGRSAPDGEEDERRGAIAWWRNHMGAMIGLYFVASVAGWLVKEWDGGFALGGFVLLAVAATVGGIYRGHLLFSERTHRRPALLGELRRAGAMLLSTDLIIASVLVLEGLWTARARAVPGVLIVGLGLGVALARLLLEPSTTAAAFGTREAT